jgi:hypothetical protein
MSRRFRTRVLAGAVLGLFAANASAQLDYLGQQTLPTGFLYSGTQVGGLSGIDRDPGTGMYWAISDDRSQTSAARFYNLSLDLALFQRSKFARQRRRAVQQLSDDEDAGRDDLRHADGRS